MLKDNLGEGMKLDCDAVHTQVNFLQGKVLTVIDAAFNDREQRKAVKDIIKNAFSDQLTYIRTLCYPDIRMMTSDEAKSTISDIEEITGGAEETE